MKKPFSPTKDKKELNFNESPQEIDDLFASIIASPSPYHASRYFCDRVLKKGQLLKADEAWSPIISLQRKKNENNIFAFLQEGAFFAMKRPTANHFTQFLKEGKIRLWVAHTDSPCLKIKNDGVVKHKKYTILSTESYGGIIDESWFNKDLSIAGRVTTHEHLLQKEVNDRYLLVDFKRPIGVIPALAPHLGLPATTPANGKLNRENHLRALIATGNKNSAGNKKNDEWKNFLAKECKLKAKDILSYDLFFYPNELPALAGCANEMISSRSLDNLAMCHAGIYGFLMANTAKKKNDNCLDIVALFNHEEIGSLSSEGAGSFLLVNFLRRVLAAMGGSVTAPATIHEEDNFRLNSRSFAISADMGHPSYFHFPEKNNESLPVELNAGIVLKRKSGLQYATQSYSEAKIKALMEKHGIPWQMGIGRSDIRGGATLGPIIASRLGIPVVDLGSALFSMHSTRELGGVKDHIDACALAKHYFS